MVRYEINHYIHPGIMSTADKRFKLAHPVLHVNSNIGVYIIVILYRIRRTCFTFHYIRIIRTNSFSTVIGLGGMFNYACVPNVGHPKFLNLRKNSFSNVIHLARTILLIGSVGDTMSVGISKNSRKKLINYRFTIHRSVK